ncbi:MAG TPA: choice-of-anchor tandem repeat NxxGxxAF-containing protein, partial [Gemmataceae bacterium]|nr:choice-of-anchor tandem repeat NxxGxxAF-containing protein [Gemmataceae bacterium]
MTHSGSIRGRSPRASALVGLFASLALHILPAPAAAQVVITPVAVSGAAAPAGGNYLNFWVSNGNVVLPPVINASGQVAFHANLTGGSSTGGIFAGHPGALQAAALAGSPAPAGGNFGQFDRSPVLNASGQLAFWAGLSGGSSTEGIFAGVPGSVQAVALQGTAAPAGGTFSTFDGGPYLNAGQVAFYASLTGGLSTGGIFAGPPGSVQAAALLGSAAPAGGSYSVIGRQPALNASGQLAFWA